METGIDCCTVLGKYYNCLMSSRSSLTLWHRIWWWKMSRLHRLHTASHRKTVSL